MGAEPAAVKPPEAPGDPQQQGAAPEQGQEATQEKVQGGVADPRLAGNPVRFVSNPQTGLEAAAGVARSRGYEAHILGSAIEGEAKDVSANGGLVDLAMQELAVRTTPRNIPDGVTIDVSAMTMDTVIRVEDIPLPSGVTAEADPDAPVVTVLTMRTPVLDAEEAAAEEAAAEAAAEGGEGEGGSEAADADSE